MKQRMERRGLGHGRILALALCLMAVATSAWAQTWTKQLADGVTIEYITQGTNNTKTRAKIGDDWYVTDAIFKQVCADRDTAIADKERYSKIIDAKEEWALSLDKRLNATDADRQLLATILDALERNEDVFIRECRTPRDDRDGRWLVSQNCVTEKFTYIKEMKG